MGIDDPARKEREEKRKEWEENMKKAIKLTELKMMENALHSKPILLSNDDGTENYFTVNARIGGNNYHVNIKTIQDVRIVETLMLCFRENIIKVR